MRRIKKCVIMGERNAAGDQPRTYRVRRNTCGQDGENESGSVALRTLRPRVGVPHQHRAANHVSQMPEPVLENAAPRAEEMRQETESLT